MNSPQPYPVETVRKVQQLPTLHVTGSSSSAVEANGRLIFSVYVAGNGANFVVNESSE